VPSYQVLFNVFGDGLKHPAKNYVLLFNELLVFSIIKNYLFVLLRLEESNTVIQKFIYYLF